MKTVAYLTTAITLITLLGGVRPAAAQDTSDKIINSFYEHGQKMLDDGNYQEAINDFSRAFLLDPREEKLHDALKSLSRESNVPAAQKMELILIEDLLDYTAKLQEKSEYFLYKRNVLGEELIKKGFEAEYFQEEMAQISDDVRTQFDSESEKIQERYAKGEDPLKVIHALLKLENKRLQKEVDLYERQYNRLREVNSQHGYIQGELAYMSQGEFAQQQKFYDQQGRRVPSPTPAPIQPETTPQTVSGEMTKMLDEATAKVDNMYTVLEDRDSKIDQLSQEVVELSLELTETRETEKTQTEEIDKLRSELVEFESKNLLTQRLEKNFKTLKDKLKETEKKLKNKEREIASLDTKVKDLVAKSADMEEQLKGRDEKIAEYQRELKTIQQEAKNIDRFKEDVAKLKEQLAKAESYQDEAWKLRYQVVKFKQKEKQFDKMERQVEEQKEVINQQKQELAAKDDEIKAKDETIRDLNKQLLDLESRFELSQKIISEKEVKIQALETELASTQDEVSGLVRILDEYRRKLVGADKKGLDADAMAKAMDNDVKSFRALVEKGDGDKFVITRTETPSISPEREKELNAIIDQKDRELRKVTQMIDIYKNNLEEANQDIDYQKEQIDELTKELARLDDKLLQRDRLSREKINHIELLKDLLEQEKQKRDMRNDKLRDLVRKKVMEIQELEGMLEIYKLKLKDTHFDAKEKEEMMSDLQVQLDMTLVELYDKSQSLGKTRHNLVVLTDQLAEINNRLTQLQTNPPADAKKEDVEAEIESLQTKINDINAFLRKEIKIIEQQDTPSMTGTTTGDQSMSDALSGELNNNRI